MNCKPNDMAIVVRVYGGGIRREIASRLLGMIVQVKTPYTRFAGTYWAIDPIDVVRGGITYTVHGLDDAILRPIRDQPGEDEVIRRIGKPEQVAA